MLGKMTEMLCSFTGILDTWELCTRGIDRVFIVPVSGVSTVSLLLPLPRGEKLCPADQKPTSTTYIDHVVYWNKSQIHIHYIPFCDSTLVTLIIRIMYLSFVLFLITFTFSCILFATQTTAQDYDALTNIQLGMQGLMQAGSDPAMLAQLMQDMQVRFNTSNGSLLSFGDHNLTPIIFCVIGS